MFVTVHQVEREHQLNRNRVGWRLSVCLSICPLPSGNDCGVSVSSCQSRPSLDRSDIRITFKKETMAIRCVRRLRHAGNIAYDTSLSFPLIWPAVLQLINVTNALTVTLISTDRAHIQDKDDTDTYVAVLQPHRFHSPSKKQLSFITLSPLRWFCLDYVEFSFHALYNFLFRSYCSLRTKPSL